MDFSFKCHRCGTRNHTAVENIGTMIRCAECGIELEVPLTAFSSGMVEAEYWVHHKVGTGSVSEVYVSKLLSTANGDDDDANKLYMKVMSPLATVDEHATGRFFSNLLKSRQVVHPNVLSILETGIIKGHCFFTTPYVEGECLDARIERDGPLSEEEALKVCLRVAKLMQQVWNDHRLLHQALKPANILINADGDVFLLDICNSKQDLVPNDGRLESINPKGNLFDYMSPEQIQNLPDMDPTSDVYSLGASLHFMICGEKPYTDTMTSSIVQKHLWKPPPQLEAYNQEVSAETAELVRWMMTGSQSGDYRTWEELIDRIRPIYKSLRKTRSQTKTKTKSTTKTGPIGKTKTGPISKTKTGSIGNRTKIRALKERRHPRRETEVPGASAEVYQPRKKSSALLVVTILVVLFMGALAAGGIVWLNSRDNDGPTVAKRLDDGFLETRLKRIAQEGQATPSSVPRHLRALKNLRERTNDPNQLNDINALMANLSVAASGSVATVESPGKPPTPLGSEPPRVNSLMVRCKDGRSFNLKANEPFKVASSGPLESNFFPLVDDRARSVAVAVEGTKYGRTDNKTPFSLHPTNQFISLAHGKYRLAVTPYSELDGKGVAGATVRFELTVENSPATSKGPFVKHIAVHLGNDKPVEVHDGKSISGNVTGDTLKVNIYAICSDDTRAVKTEVVGTQYSKQDGKKPFTIGKHGAPIYLKPGTYTITSTPSSGNNGGSGETVKVTLVLKKSDGPAKPPTPVTLGVVELRLIDATEKDVGALKDKQVIDLNKIKRFNIVARTVGSKVHYVKFKITGNGKPIENIQDHAPYAVWGHDRKGNFFDAKSISPGTYTITASAHGEGRRYPAVGKPLTQTFTIKGKAEPSRKKAEGVDEAKGIKGFKLVDLSGKWKFVDMDDNFVISRNKTPKFTITVVSDSKVRSVVFELTGKDYSHRRHSSREPFGVWGATKRNNLLSAKGLKPGTYVLTATGYTGKSETPNGKLGKPKKLTFVVTP